MRKFAKVFSIIFFFSFLLVMTLPFAFATSIYWDGTNNYSALPEPVPTDQVKYFVITNPNNGWSYLLMFTISLQTSQNVGDFSVTASYSSSNGWTFSLYNNNGLNVIQDFSISWFDSRTGAYRGYKHLTGTQSNMYYASYTIGQAAFNQFISYGVQYDNISGLSTAKFNWQAATDHDFQQYLLTQSLNSIELYLDSIDSYSGQITTDFFDYIHWVQNTFYPSFVNETTQIINKLNKIIELLGGDYSSTEIPQPSQADDINELASAEAAIQRDVGSDMQSAFSSYGQVFTGNGAFALIKTGFESFILDNNKINALIVFCLTLGIGVLIIGRRIQA